MTFGPSVRVTDSFADKQAFIPLQVCTSTHARASFVPYLGNSYLLLWLICPQNPPVWPHACEGGKAALAHVLRFAPQAPRLCSTLAGRQEHTHKCPRDATLGPPASLEWSCCCLHRAETYGSVQSFYCLPVAKAPTCSDVDLWVPGAVLALFAPFPAASYFQALALISAQCCELLSLCEVSGSMGYPGHEFTDDF